jgi:hypothetical protein
VACALQLLRQPERDPIHASQHQHVEVLHRDVGLAAERAHGMRCTMTITLRQYGEMRSGVCGQRGSGGNAFRVSAEADAAQIRAQLAAAPRFTSNEFTGEPRGVPRRRFRAIRHRMVVHERRECWMRCSLLYFPPHARTNRKTGGRSPSSSRAQARSGGAGAALALLAEAHAETDLAKLDDPEVWRKIPILDKDTLRTLSDAQFYSEFCLMQHDGVAEYWRSGGVTGQPLFYRAASATSSTAWSRSRAPSTAPAPGAASAPTSRSRWASIRSARSTRAAPRRAASR